MMKKNIAKDGLLFLLLCCVFSRIATAIYYIEDIDSLRFALSLSEYNLIKLQPHFPGYPVFWFFSKILFLFTNNLGLTFSLVGGLSIFVVIYFTLKLYDIKLNSLIGFFCAGTIFCNPLLWLMSNRFMPDLMGLSISISALYFFSIVRDNNKNIILGFFLFGLLAGVRLSYIPFLIVPVSYHFIIQNNKYMLFSSFFIGCVVWFLPLIYFTGIDDLYIAALDQTRGHFFNFGGTFITDSDWIKRIISIIKYIWADGLGGYWKGRSWQTIFLSISMVYLIISGLLSLKKPKDKTNFLIFFGSAILYLSWILFFQNIIYKSRHILPLLIFFIIFIINGIKSIYFRKNLLDQIVIAVFFLSLINITLVLVQQHRTPSAISQIKDDLVNTPNKQTIISIPLINYYLNTHGIKADFISVDEKIDIEKIYMLAQDDILLIGNFSRIFVKDFDVVLDTNYYHNPYVNRMWPHIGTFRLFKKKNVR